MSRTYKATGINLKAMPLGESDRLLTVLTREYGLVRMVAPGARKTRSQLGGRTGLFVVNELLIAKGRTLDKISQAETLITYAGLSKNLTTLTASQYLAELVIYQALSEQPQTDLFDLLCQQLLHLEQASETEVLSVLTRSVFQLLAWAGIAPQVWHCCLSRRPIAPDFSDPDWRIGFSYQAGGTIDLSALEQELSSLPTLPVSSTSEPRFGSAANPSQPSSPAVRDPNPRGSTSRGSAPATHLHLTAVELEVLQQLSVSKSPEPVDFSHYRWQYPTWVWLAVERTLRQYIQFYLDRPIRSAALMDACFSPLSSAPCP